MAISTGQVILNTTTPTLIVPARRGRDLLVLCSHGAIVLIGDETVSQATGAMVLPDRRGDKFVLAGVTDAVYGLNLDVDNFPVSFIEVY